MDTLVKRFWPKVEKTSANECWTWLGAKLPKGYGKIAGRDWRGGWLYAHRVSWELHNGPVQDGLWVLHHCDNPSCVNPAHLFLGTNRDNMRDMQRKGRARTCGHSITLENTYVIRGARLCRACMKLRDKRYRDRHKKAIAARHLIWQRANRDWISAYRKQRRADAKATIVST